MDLKETDILGAEIGSHWYYRSKAEAVVRLLADHGLRTILDVGAGSGFFSRYLLARSGTAEAWCVDISYDKDSDATEAGKAIHFRRSVDRVDANLVLMMDVLEHVRDDVGLLREYADKVPAGSRFLVSVPAFSFLWSGHDEFLEHRRRYTLPQLEDTVRKAGLTLVRGVYFFGFVFPLAAAIRLAERCLPHDRPVRSHLTQHHPMVNGVLATMCRIELPLMRLNRLAGLTVFCLARKA